MISLHKHKLSGKYLHRTSLTACDHMVTLIIQMQNKKQFLPNNQVPMLTTYHV